MKSDTVWIGNDHGGVDLKRAVVAHLTRRGVAFHDVGSDSPDIVRYPLFAEQVAAAVSRGEAERGILICSTGIGMSIIANKFSGVRASLCTSAHMGRMTRAHNDSNLLCLGGKITDVEEALAILEAWLDTSFEGGRHCISLDLIAQAERVLLTRETWTPRAGGQAGAGAGTMATNALPRTLRFRQSFPLPPALDIRGRLDAGFAELRPRIQPGARIAVGVGSRGIAHLPEIVGAVLDQLRAAGAQPFIIPAMGSHGGATPVGQREVLASYGITEATMGVPIRDSLEVRQVGATSAGVPVFCSTEALAADGILLVNRIKPHTDFVGTVGSGLLKMSVIGLGKRTGAAAMHLAAARLGYEPVIRSMAGVLLRNAPVLGGVAILESQLHDTARLLVIPREEMEAAEAALLAEARALLPRLPFEEIDLLIVDRMGKNISGAGMDPGVINRSVHGYDSLSVRGDRPAPFVRRIFVRALTPETHGNAIGIGMADATTARLVREMDPRVTGINALTALTPQSAKVPVAFDTDREAIQQMLASLPLPGPGEARIVRIADTLSLGEMEVSESLWDEARAQPGLTALGEPGGISFDAEGNLNPL